MKSDIAISVRGIGKTYRVARTQARSTTLAELVAQKLRKPFTRRQRETEFEALDDVSFEVHRGEVLGIIGRNGAGKSTLLKILSQITPPTRGEIDLYGRVGSLLEVGTGFHPELTGRENIYLNGAILGMSRHEIDREFDGIVAFAETERFLDLPVKRYSSGMYVRLAFAVAAHLRPEILFVDEVLAVGDAAFQRKCLGKMQDVTHREGGTVLFVSHNLAAIHSLTSRCLHLDQGRAVAIGPTAGIVASYLARFDDGSCEWTAPGPSRHPLQINRVHLLDVKGQPTGQFEAEQEIVVELSYEVRQSVTNVVVEFYVLTLEGVHLLTSGDHDTEPARYERRLPGQYTARVRLPGSLLNLGSYVLRINSGTHQETFDHADVLTFQIHEPRQLTARHNRRGLLVPMLPWSVTQT
jgi:lipopolysaccharide transport system ATP-binding protein